MLITDIVISARRILGDTKSQRWSNERMLDIVNGGLRDINRHTGAYRAEHFFELQPYKYRYALPVDLLQVTSVIHDSNEVCLVNKRDTTGELSATKDQLNIGILELKNIPEVLSRDKRFFGGPSGFLVPQPDFDLWQDGLWNNTSAWRDDQLWGVPYISLDAEFGVTVNPLLNPLGVTTGVSLPASVFDNLKPKTEGLLSDVRIIDDEATIAVSSSGDSFGVLTAFDAAITFDSSNGGSIGTINNAPYRIAGRYGTVVSVLKPSEYVQVMYKSLPQVLTSLETAFPLSPSWIEPMVNWVVGTALQDDNDAGNNQRALVFLGRYERDMAVELKQSNTDYSSQGKKYDTKYMGGIK